MFHVPNTPDHTSQNQHFMPEMCRLHQVLYTGAKFKLKGPWKNGIKQKVLLDTVLSLPWGKGGGAETPPPLKGRMDS